MRVRLLTAAFVVGSAALGFVPIASAATEVAAPDVEAWFQPNPTCATPAGCLSPETLPVAPPVPVPPPPAEVPTSPFPAGTLHVGVSGGQETARTYLGLPTSAFTDATAARLTVPLDVDPASGGQSPETATLQVCLTSAPLAAVSGSFAAPPDTDCSKTAVVSYVATPEPRLEADLRPLLEALPGARGLVLLPDATTLAPSDAWRVVFSATSRTGEGVPAPASVALTTAPPAPDEAPQPVAAPPVLQQPGLTAAPPTSLAAVDPVAAELGEVPLPTSVEAPLAQAPAVPETIVPVQDVGFPQTVRVGYAYPGVWLLPLLLLVVVPLIGRTLTRDLSPARAG